MKTASASSSSGRPAITSPPSPVPTGSRWKLCTSPPSSDAAHTTTPPSSTSRPSPSTPWAPQPMSAREPSRASTAARPSSTLSRFALAAKTATRSGRAPPSPSWAREAASAKASTPSSRGTRPVAILIAPSSQRAPFRLSPDVAGEAPAASTCRLRIASYSIRSCPSSGGGPGSWPISMRNLRAEVGASAPRLLLNMTWTKPASSAMPRTRPATSSSSSSV